MTLDFSHTASGRVGLAGLAGQALSSQRGGSHNTGHLGRGAGTGGSGR